MAVYYRKTQFAIDGSELLSIGWTADERWNGWACPRFEKEEADKILEDFNLGAEHQARYNEEKDTYYFPSIFDDEVEWDEYQGQIINTFEGPKKIYTIGSGFWVWDDMSEHNGRVNNGLLHKEQEKEEE